jgi:methionine-S-sulfoxide reductase
MLRIVAAVVAVAALLALATTPRAQDAPAPREGVAVATFGSGCFWCTEADFDKVPGVLTTTSGYMGGKTPNPSYEQVGTGRTGHAEVMQLTYDPSKVSYRQLLDHYWRTTDVLDGTGQFCDRGSQYRPAILTHTPEQLKLATDAKAALEKSGRFDKPIAVEIAPATAFTAAEDYHQDYYKKNPLRYKFYRHGCGREARLEALWGAEAGK